MILIVYAHPQTKGHGPLILEEVEKTLKERKERYEVLDLYKMGYDPLLHEDEHYTSGGYHVSKENKAMQKKIEKADRLLFIHPLWWFSMPAVLKGWLDRVLTGRWAFRYLKTPLIGARPIGLLKGRKARILMTSGTPAWAFWHPGILAAQQVLKRSLQFCGIRTRCYQLWACTSLDENTPPRIERFVARALRGF